MLKAKYYNMIARGEKKEEYRGIKPYWMSRLFGIKEPSQLAYCLDKNGNYPNRFDCACFHWGYTNYTITFRIEGIKIGEGKPEWGAPINEKVFIIKLGKRIK